MPNLLTADSVVIMHFGFILFVIFGGLLALKYSKLIWLHIPAVVWAALLEFFGWICPLTTLENKLRRNTGDGPYSNGFIEHYIVPVIYPEALTRDIQMLLGLAVIAVNLIIYTFFYYKYFVNQEKND